MEYVLFDFSKLKINLRVVILVYQLEILHASSADPAIEIQREALRFLAPFWLLIGEMSNVFLASICQDALYRAVIRLLLFALVKLLLWLTVTVDHRRKHVHEPRSFAFTFQQIPGNICLNLLNIAFLLQSIIFKLQYRIFILLVI